MDIGDEVVILSNDRLARVCDFTGTGYYVQLLGSDAKTFVRKHEVRRAERSDVIRLQARQRQNFLMPARKEHDPIQALLIGQRRKEPPRAGSATDAIEKFLRDEA